MALNDWGDEVGGGRVMKNGISGAATVTASRD